MLRKFLLVSVLLGLVFFVLNQCTSEKPTAVQSTFVATQVAYKQGTRSIEVDSVNQLIKFTGKGGFVLVKVLPGADSLEVVASNDDGLAGKRFTFLKCMTDMMVACQHTCEANASLLHWSDTQKQTCISCCWAESGAGCSALDWFARIFS